MSITKPTLLITGISGFLGSHFLQHHLADWTLRGIYHRQKVKWLSGMSHSLDLTQWDTVMALLDRWSPQAICHLAALSNGNFCEQHPDLSYAINVQASLRLAEYARQADIPYLFASTDLVFDGKQAPYTETDEPAALSVYGQHKALAERLILAEYPEAIVARLPLMYGFSAYAPNFLSAWLSQLKREQPIKAFWDEYRTAAYAPDVVKGLLQLLAGRYAGIWHLGGAERLSRYDFIVQVAQRYGLDTSLIHSTSQADVAMAAPRPADVSLDSQKAFHIGYRPRKIAEIVWPLL
ncbi:MAG: NAD(P)-dependent oxidoreductase [Bacteroidota bacterium]